MIEALVVTLPPLSFLTVLFSTGEKFRGRNIDVDGRPPIDRTAFYLSKYAILVVWLAMVLRSWNLILPIEISQALKWLSLPLWIAGFALLFVGRFGLGDSFRIGSPKEATDLHVDGLFSVSRNPMYVGVFSTLIAAFLYTLNPLIFCVAAFIIAIHHKIVLAEEQYLQNVFGDVYLQYCSHVHRYL